MKRLMTNNFNKILPITPIYPIDYYKNKENLVDKRKKDVEDNGLNFEDILNEELRRI